MSQSVSRRLLDQETAEEAKHENEHEHENENDRKLLGMSQTGVDRDDRCSQCRAYQRRRNATCEELDKATFVGGRSLHSWRKTLIMLLRLEEYGWLKLQRISYSRHDALTMCCRNPEKDTQPLEASPGKS